MPRLYNINTFSPLLLDLIRAVHARGRIEVPHPSKTAATRARFTFYDLKKALRQAHEPHLQELALMAEAITITLNGDVVVYGLRDRDPETQALARALMNAGAIPHATPDMITDEIDTLNTFPITPAPRTQESLLADFLPKPQKTVDSSEA